MPKIEGGRLKLELEAEMARSIVTAMEQDIADIERWWPASRRGSNGQQAIDSLKSRVAAAAKCLKDGLEAP